MSLLCWVAALPALVFGNGVLPSPNTGETIAEVRGKPQIAYLVHYTGHVQGVGFRATTVEIAQDYPVTGWVKNLPDGRVELLVEGPQEAVSKFLRAVEFRWETNITIEQRYPKEPTGQFARFVVR